MSQTSFTRPSSGFAKNEQPVSNMKLDTEFATAIARSPVPAAPPGDIETKRAFAKKAFGAFLDATRQPPRVAQNIYHTKAQDGHDVPIFHFFSKSWVSERPTSAIFHIHGGGMIMGDVQTLAPLISDIAYSTGVPVFAVDYRLAPEHPHPTLVEDSYAGLLWLRDHADDFNIDPARIIIHGESAGGGIAAGVTLMARDRNIQPALAKQMLICPMLDDRNTVPVPELVPFLTWTYEENLVAWGALLGNDVAGTDSVCQYAAPARAETVAGLPPTYIDVGELDAFRDEDFKYAARIAAANIAIEFHVYPGVPHGFDSVAPSIDVAKRAHRNRVKALTSV